MLTEFLQTNPMQELLKSGTRMLYPTAENRTAWDGIPAEYRQEILEMAEEVGITVISSPLTTYTACGELYLHGLPGTKPKKPAPEGA